MSLRKIIREGRWIIPTIGLQGIAMREVGLSGFGDRLRGLALALFLAKYHRTKNIFYNDTANDQHTDLLNKAFPFRMNDLLDMEGMNFVPCELPFPPRTLEVIHDCIRGSSLKRYGRQELWRLRPKNREILVRLDRQRVNQTCLGFHVRGTDALATARYQDGIELLTERALHALQTFSDTQQMKRVFLAADSVRGLDEWRERLTSLSYEVVCNDRAQWNESVLRQTGADDMLFDFFGLSRCRKIFRLVPSEFSRFAAWRQGRRCAFGRRAKSL
ncbi:MAG: hypothetical protein ACYC3X_17605 [Pirellulaceae bacterium]